MTLQELWDARRVPVVSGIFFASGEVRTLITNSDHDGRTELIQGEVRSIDKICSEDTVSYASIDAIFQATFVFDSRIIEIFCGEGGYGGDGFVCAAENNAVLWLAFFEYSNPFISVARDRAYIVANNNCGEKWRFPIASPQQVSVALHI